MNKNESMNFSFFRYTRSKSGSGRVRGKQIANYIGAKLNPDSGYENDICIYVKRKPPENFPKTTYLDVVDSMFLMRWVKDHPEVGVIGITKLSQEFMSKELNRKDICMIPQHHCNFEQNKRKPREVKVVGYIGGSKQLQYNHEKLKDELAEIGLDFKYKTGFYKRSHVTSFLESIDINIAFRYRKQRRYLKDALKLVNAGSFGIPSVAFPEKGYEAEFKDCYIKANSGEELIAGCKRLAEDKELYNDLSEKALAKSESYHIDKIIPLYKNLKVN